MRKQITLYDDQYAFYKELKSKRLLVAFVEYMFEDVEPVGLNEIEKVVRNSLKIRMENQKKKSDAGSQSHGGGRKKIESNTSSELGSKNNTTNNKKTTEQTTKKQQDKGILSYDNIQEEVKDINNLSNDKLDNEVVQYGDEGINNLCSKISEVYKKHGLTIDTSNRKYAGQRVRKGELVKAKKEWLDSHGYENVEQFVNDIISRAKTIKYGNWLSKISDLYGLWKHKDEILNQTHKAIEPGTLEHFNWFCENYVGKKTYHDIDGDKPYTKAMYFNYLMSEYGWDRPKARETRDKMLGR